MCEIVREMTREELVACNNELMEENEKLKEARFAVEHNNNLVQEERLRHELFIDPVRHGKWIDDCTCSVCHWIHEDGEGFALLTNYPFCPNCGAKMDEVEK